MDSTIKNIVVKLYNDIKLNEDNFEMRIMKIQYVLEEQKAHKFLIKSWGDLEKDTRLMLVNFVLLVLF